jgi:dihydrofolate reductase
MAKVRILSIGVSLDGYAAGPDQSLENPLGVGGIGLMRWLFATHTFARIHGRAGGETGVDDEFAAAGFENIGAWIIGRNMFGPVRGPWPDDAWKGWWGAEPPYHTPVFVLTHHARASIPMQGGTVFHFVTGGIHEALERAHAAANGKDVRVGGGVSTIRQFLLAGLVDEIHFAHSPVLLGRGENLLTGIDLLALGYKVDNHVPSQAALHVKMSKKIV